MDLGVKPQRIVSGFCSHWGGKCIQSTDSVDVCATSCRSDHARKEFCVGRNLTSRPPRHFSRIPSSRTRTPYRRRTQDTTQQQAFNGEVFPRRYEQIRRPRSECVTQNCCNFSLSPLPVGRPTALTHPGV